VLGSECPLRSVNAERHEPEERVQIEAGESAEVASHAGVALEKDRLAEEGNPDRSEKC
jgi:hypothetical protein